MVVIECDDEGFNLNLRHKRLVGLVWNKQQIENEGTPIPPINTIFVSLCNSLHFAFTSFLLFSILSALLGHK